MTGKFLRHLAITGLMKTYLSRAIMGAVTLSALTSQIVSQNMQPSDSVKKAVYKKSIKVYEDANLGKVGRILETEPFVFILSQKDGKIH